MTTIERAELKTNWKFLTDHIQQKHEMGQEIFDELFVKNKPVRGLCHERRYFVIMGEYFLSYDMEHIIADPNLFLIGRSLRRVNLFDSYQEYESTRVKEMSGKKDQTGLNFN